MKKIQSYLVVILMITVLTGLKSQTYEIQRNCFSLCEYVEVKKDKHPEFTRIDSLIDCCSPLFIKDNLASATVVLRQGGLSAYIRFDNPFVFEEQEVGKYTTIYYFNLQDTIINSFEANFSTTLDEAYYSFNAGAFYSSESKYDPYLDFEKNIIECDTRRFSCHPKYTQTEWEKILLILLQDMMGEKEITISYSE